MSQTTCGARDINEQYCEPQCRQMQASTSWRKWNQLFFRVQHHDFFFLKMRCTVYFARLSRVLSKEPYLVLALSFFLSFFLLSYPRKDSKELPQLWTCVSVSTLCTAPPAPTRLLSGTRGSNNGELKFSKVALNRSFVLLAHVWQEGTISQAVTSTHAPKHRWEPTGWLKTFAQCWYWWGGFFYVCLFLLFSGGKFLRCRSKPSFPGKFSFHRASPSLSSRKGAPSSSSHQCLLWLLYFN